MPITTSELVRAISDLPTNRDYRYVNTRTTTHVRILRITLPEGPITIMRYDPVQGEGIGGAEETTISTQMIARIAYSLVENQPINFDRVLGGSYNTRSALEALLAHTPQFYFCYPGRVDSYTGEIKTGHKHLIWCPNEPHEMGVLSRKNTDIVISESPNLTFYDVVSVPPELLTEDDDIEIRRQHARIQIALTVIGLSLGYRVWVAQNDRGLIYNGRRISDYDGVLQSMRNDQILISSFADAIQNALLIDAIWFGNHRYMPAVLEVEHTTGVVSGLNRMLRFHQSIPAVNTRFVIVAPDDDRQLVTREANREQFRVISPKYFPYSAVEELLWLVRRRNLRGITQEFIDSYLDEVTR